jgi:hypothetical protein
MSIFNLSEAATHDVRGYHPAQVIFFAMTSRKKTAVVVRAFISKSAADIAAREIDGCVRVGRMTLDGKASSL